jgi:hypothetical protein
MVSLLEPGVDPATVDATVARRKRRRRFGLVIWFHRIARFVYDLLTNPY